ncbi:MAG TPA: Wzz/FepE/Etk N-terminal domain-containing protein [Bryobacteraceae bacterium]|nr:Wzz/FepE/Etk N-terminal domain-containing protein [Bryobacteraceae bacterium]
MAAPFGLLSYISYIQSRWRLIALSCVTATAIAVAVSAVLPREFTAAARIVIEPPAGTDPRGAVAVSPIYLESLKTYEQFASSDSLFRTAVERFGVRALVGNRPVEALKKQVLKVSLLRNTRILEISATLPDPRKAQSLAQFVAESTVELTRSLVSDGDRDLLRDMERQQQEMRTRLQKAEAEWAEATAREPVASLQAEAENSALLRSSLEEQLSNVDLEITDAAERAQHASAEQAAQIASDRNNARARRDQIRGQLEALERKDAERDRLLAGRFAHRERLDTERKAAQAQLTAVETQLREARSATAYRGERLKIIDPGIVPERPSSPNIPLNAAAAFLLGLALPVLWLGLQMNYREQRALQSFAEAIDD